VSGPGTGTSEVQGPYGSALELEMEGLPNSEETVCHWLITAPAFHPFWSQYILAVVRLRDLPGFPPPVRQFQGATHELLVVTLNPEHGPYDAGLPRKYAAEGNLPYLTPINIAHQIEGTDSEAGELAAWAAWGVVNGHLEPESSNGAERIRAEWESSLVKTLAHMRGEEHAP
jgi:hypothetical protein